MGMFDLWLPILLAAVGVFVASSVFHIVIEIHKGDFAKLPGEETLLAAMREQGVQQGDYMFPFAGSMKEMGTPEHIETCNLGPVGVVLPVGDPEPPGHVLGQVAGVSVLHGGHR